MLTQTYPAVLRMKNFDNLFIELTSKYCNQRCKYCYIDFPKYKKKEDFIDTDLVKKTLSDIENLPIKCIYLTGAEPMTHPNFNMILRMCLKYSNVCICTNGSFINEKKARFLKKVEDESENQIIFKLPLIHYDELKNDEIRYRGSFRHTIFALKFLLKYELNSVVSVSNFYKEPEKVIIDNLFNIFTRMDIKINSKCVCVVPWHFDNSDLEKSDNFKIKSDCEYGRVLTSNGIFTCPFLSNDYRGRCGSTLKDFSDKCKPETNYCLTCLHSGKTIFGLDFNNLN